MNDFTDDFLDSESDPLLSQLKKGLERRKSLVASNEDISGTHESVDGQWTEWMCADCGIFMKEHRHHCRLCNMPRI